MAFNRPAFLGAGMFAWNAFGYRYVQAPDINLGSAAALDHDNPWIVLAAVLDRAKNGEFSVMPLLLSNLRRADSWVLARACAELLGDASPCPLLKDLIKQFDCELFDDQDLRFQVNISHSLYLCGSLWTVPILLRIYERVADDPDGNIIPVLLSHLLEPNIGRLATPSLSGSVRAYAQLIMSKYHELCDEYHTSHIPVFYGRVFSVSQIATHLYNELRNKDINAITVCRDRHKFEAATGIDCSGFFERGQLRALAATAIVESFLESSDIGKFEEGVRYFFGHRIPE